MPVTVWVPVKLSISDQVWTANEIVLPGTDIDRSGDYLFVRQGAA